MNIATYLQRLSRQLTVVPAKREEILEEVTNHLLEITERLQEQGTAHDQAEAQAIVAFGSVGSVAANINRVHPLDWDLRRTIASITIGAAVTFALSTLITSLFVLVSTRAQIISSIAWDMTPFSWPRFFLDATPGSFTLYQMVLSQPHEPASPYAPMLLTLFLSLYGLTPFLWGSRAARGWQAGLAYGLGSVLGMIWLLPGTIYLFVQPHIHEYVPVVFGNMMLLTWLLVPFAVLASIVGQRFFTPFATRSIRRRGMLPSWRAWLTSHIFGYRHIATVCISLALVILLAANALVIAQIASTRVSPSALSAQLVAARKQVIFPIREPHYLSQGMTLRKVEYGETSCGFCSIYLRYSDENGRQMSIGEEGFPLQPDQYIPPTWPKYDLMNSLGFPEIPFWWLPAWQIKQGGMIVSDWLAGKVVYVIDFQGNFSHAEIQKLITGIGQS